MCEISRLYTASESNESCDTNEASKISKFTASHSRMSTNLIYSRKGVLTRPFITRTGQKRLEQIGWKCTFKHDFDIV